MSKGKKHMIQKLISAIQKTQAPIVVGLDPKLSFIPQRITEKAYSEYGETAEGAAQALWAFNKEIKRVFEEKYLTKEKREALKEKIGRAFEVLKNRRERYYAEKETAPKDSSEK